MLLIHARAHVLRARPVQSHDQRHDPVDPLDALFLGRLPVVGGVGLDRAVQHFQHIVVLFPANRMPVVTGGRDCQLHRLPS